MLGKDGGHISILDSLRKLDKQVITRRAERSKEFLAHRRWRRMEMETFIRERWMLFDRVRTGGR